MAFLLDTNVISEARRQSPDSKVRIWLASVPEPELYLSVLVVGEVRQGIERLRRRIRRRPHRTTAGCRRCCTASPTGSSRSPPRSARNGAG